VSPIQASSAITRSWHCQREREPDADREAVDRRDQRLLEIDVARLAAAAPVEQRIVRVLVRRAHALGLVLARNLTSRPAQNALPAPVKMPHVDVGIERDVAPARAQLRVGIRVQRVAHVGRLIVTYATWPFFS
jgi:hypothetical protein